MDEYGIYLSDSFKRDIKKLSEQNKKQVFDKIEILKNNQLLAIPPPLMYII